MGGARIGGGDKPSIAPEKTLGRGPICSAAFSLRKPPRNSLILRHGVLTKLPLSRPPRCVAARSPLPPPSPLLTSPLLLRVFLRASAPPRQNHPLHSPAPLPRFPIPFRLGTARGIELCISASLCVAAVSRIGSALAGLGRGPHPLRQTRAGFQAFLDRKSTRLNSSHRCISYAV